MALFLRGSLKKKIQTLLKRYVALRDSDSKLIANLWAQEYRQRLGRPLTQDEEGIFRILANGTLPNAESIRRCRQKLQEENEDLRGFRYAERTTTLEERVRQEVIACSDS